MFNALVFKITPPFDAIEIPGNVWNSSFIVYSQHSNG